MARALPIASLILLAAATSCSPGVPGSYSVRLDFATMQKGVEATENPQARDIMQRLVNKMRALEGEFHFHDDGTFRASMSGNPTSTGTWELDGSALTLIGKGPQATQRIEGTFVDGEITLHDASGNMILTRIPASPR